MPCCLYWIMSYVCDHLDSVLFRITSSKYAAACRSVIVGAKRARSCLIVWPRKQGNPVPSINVTRLTIDSW